MSIETYWEKSAVNKGLIIGLVVWIALMIASAFYDLTISKFLFNERHIVGKLVESYGEIPGLLAIIFAFVIFGVNLKTKGVWRKIFLVITSIIVALLIVYLLSLILSSLGINFDFLSLYGIPIGLFFLLISFLLIYLFKTKFANFSRKNFNFSKVGTILFTISFLIVQVLKTLWGRVRFRDLQEGFVNFTSWYLPQGATGATSFPSGHVLFGWMLLPLILLFTRKKNSKIKIWIIFIASIWGLFVLFGRLLIGAHYASDILFSSGIVILLFLLFYGKYFGKKENLSTAKTSKKK